MANPINSPQPQDIVDYAPNDTGGMGVDQILAELQQEPSFAQLPQDWQVKLAGQIHDNGLAATIQMNSGWLQGNPNDPVSRSLGAWIGAAQEFMASPDFASGGDIPVEQALYNKVLPSAMADIEGDAGRRSLAATLSGQAQQDYESARTALSPEENARRLQEEYGMADTVAGRMAESAGTAASDQLRALQASIAQMQQNLTGANAAKAAALQQQIADFSANLGTYDATQKAALAEQIAAQQKNLEDSVAAQQQNLAAEITALQGAADANSVARRASLQAELQALTAAQAPMAQARLDSAQALNTAVNLGLQSTQDTLTAQRAKQGYLGSSSFSDAAMARAGIQARQQGAQAMGAAREANAADTRTIQARGATEGRSIEDELAGNNLTIAGRQATGGRTLADILAEGTRGISDTGAVGTAAIKASTGAAAQGIGNAGATQSYQDKVVGSNELQALLDTLAKGNASIEANRATQVQGATDQGTMARKNYFDNAYTRGQGALLSRPGLATNLAATLTGLDNYGNTGTQRALNTLNWWNTGGQQAPVAGSVGATVDNSGNDIAGLGAGLLSGALAVGNGQNWWQQKPKTTAPAATSNFGTYGDSPYW